MDQIPTRKPSLSPTKIVTYLACDHKYKWTYLDSRGRWFIKSKSYYSFGTSLHNVLQKLHDQDDQTVVTAEDAVNSLETHWVAEGYASADEMAEAQSRGKEILQEYVQRETKREKESRTLFVEKSLSYHFPQFVLRGRMDRIEEYPDGTLEIVDYKSGRETVTADEVHADIAMGIYQLLLEKAFPGRTVQCTIIALRTGQFATARLAPDELIQFESDLESLGKEIIAADFSHRSPVPKALCPDCDFLDLCRKSPTFALDFQALTRDLDSATEEL